MNNLKVLFIGDVVGMSACRALRKFLYSFKHEHFIDFVIANGENSADGNGITPASAQLLKESGVDFITTGNHAFRRSEMMNEWERTGVNACGSSDTAALIRPHNFGDMAPGRGYAVADLGMVCIGIGNIIGSAFMNNSCGNPFFTADELIRQFEHDSVNITIIDFHGESTGEKRAMGFYAAGRVSALVGTHTHVQTADECLMRGTSGRKTAYISDAGMCGAEESVLGIEPAAVIDRYITAVPQKYSAASGAGYVCGVIIEIDKKTGTAIDITRVREKIFI